MNLRQVLIKYILPIRWQYSKKSKISALQSFAMTELDSGWQSLYAMDFIDDPKARSVLFTHAMEEFEHSSLFNNLCKSYSDIPLDTPVVSRKVILDESKKDRILDFFCYMHVGESTVNEDFRYYANAPIDPKIGNLFKKIAKDEEHHEADSLEFIGKLAENNTWKIRKFIFINQVGRAFRQFSVLSSQFGEMILNLLLSTVYFCLGALYIKTFKSRLKMSQEDQFLILKEQVNIFNKVNR